MPIAPGQTNIFQNPEFDSRILASGAVDSKGKFIKRSKTSLYRGRIETADRYNGNIYRLQFLFNPTDFSHSGAVDPNTNIAGAIKNPDYVGSAAQFMEIQQNIPFNLLFDRTYETWDHGKNTNLRQWGVLTDIKAMYMLFGMYDDIAGADGAFTIQGSTVQDVDGVEQMSPTAPMQWRPVWVIFGPKTKYFGVINSFNVTYTHFTQQMVPNRAAVNFNLQLIPRSDPLPGMQKQQASRKRHNDTMLRGKPGFDRNGNSIL